MINTEKNLKKKKRWKNFPHYIKNVMEINNILGDLINSLKASDPYKIILFAVGSNTQEPARRLAGEL
jgi:hypothetical protein